MIIEEIPLLIQQSSYLFLFFILLLEGPIIGFIASYLSSQGFLNIFLVAIVYFLGDLVGDVIHYVIGYSIGTTHNKFFKGRFKFLTRKTTSKKLRKIHSLIEKNLFLSLIIIKITPPISSAGLISVGAKKIPFIKFLLSSAIICLMIEIPIILLGYFSGITISSFLNIQNTYNKIALLGISLIIVLFAFKFLKEYISNKLQNSN